MPSCVTWNSPDRKISLEPPMVSSEGLLKLYVKFVSVRNSPVKTLVSSGDSFVFGFPDSQVKSANANGSGFLASAGGAASVAAAACSGVPTADSCAEAGVEANAKRTARTAATA